MHLEDICTKIKERRSLLGATQQDLADISGVGLRTVKGVETHRGNPSVGTLLKMLEALGLELSVTVKRTVE